MLILGTVGVSGGGGRLLDPPGRGSEFRVGVPSVPDYDDHRLNCGGVSRQWDKWRGRCGTCGDDYGLEVPRPHELGGRFGSGRISRNYTQGQVQYSILQCSTVQYNTLLCSTILFIMVEILRPPDYVE